MLLTLVLSLSLAHAKPARTCALTPALAQRAKAAALNLTIATLNQALAEQGVQLTTRTQSKCTTYSFSFAGAGPISEKACTLLVETTNGTPLALYGGASVHVEPTYDAEGNIVSCAVVSPESGVMGLRNPATSRTVAWFYDNKGYSLLTPAQTHFTFTP